MIDERAGHDKGSALSGQVPIPRWLYLPLSRWRWQVWREALLHWVQGMRIESRPTNRKQEITHMTDQVQEATYDL